MIRFEQLFPLATDQIKAIIDSYPNVDDYVWAQEEPKNMGAYGYLLMNFDLVKLRLASPKAYSAPAAGSYERSKNVKQTLLLWFLIKIYFNNSYTTH